jgi:hypothetical protein
MDYKTFIVAVLGGVIVLAGGVVFSPEKQEVVVGALSGPDLISRYLAWGQGSVREYRARQELKQATTTVCAIQSPSSTSTLSYAAVRINLASSTATIWNVAKSNTAFATTTAIGTAHNVVASAQDFIFASTTPGGAADTLVFAPNQWLVVGVQAGVTSGDAAGTGFVPTGSCQASFIESY